MRAVVRSVLTDAPDGRVLELAEAELLLRAVDLVVSREVPAESVEVVIGVQDEVKGQVPVVFATLKSPLSDTAARQAAALALQQRVVDQLGAVARPARVYLVGALPKTRSGKLLRRSIQALAEARDAGDLSTLDDPNALEEVRGALARGADAGASTT